MGSVSAEGPPTAGPSNPLKAPSGARLVESMGVWGMKLRARNQPIPNEVESHVPPRRRVTTLAFAPLAASITALALNARQDTELRDRDTDVATLQAQLPAPGALVHKPLRLADG